jgi:predicted enzyme related to lactoylglutathione lyase
MLEMQNPVVRFEVVGKKGGELRRFYSELFGWSIAGADGDMDYGLVEPSNTGIGGAVGQSQDGGDGHVTFFVEVDGPAASQGHLIGTKEVAR